ncbi:acyl-CoA thioesterase [Candidatus Woesearchaeota archaeon]|nr:acyl-CoA thioesterase [Candidatus Woesearchaeota archaeon]
MEDKKVLESRVEIAQVMYPEHANPAGNVHGGHILKLIDQAGAIVAARHTHKNVVTASVDSMSFISPAYVGNLVFAKASLNYVGRSSMEVGVRVEAECLKTGRHTHIASAYLTFVALDEDDNPIPIPRLITETEDEKRRFEEAKKRRENRIAKRRSQKQEPCIARPEKLAETNNN